MDTEYRLRTEAAVRREFWACHPHLKRKKIKHPGGQGSVHVADTRIAFVDFVDNLSRSGDISPELAHNITL